MRWSGGTGRWEGGGEGVWSSFTLAEAVGELWQLEDPCLAVNATE